MATQHTGSPASPPSQLSGDDSVVLRFASGTIEMIGLDAERGEVVPDTCVWDSRSMCHRAPAVDYAAIVMALRGAKIPYDDQASDYQTLESGLRIHREPRPFQHQALDAWMRQRSRGVVVLPTGAGKSHVAVMAIDARQRSTLVVAPTLDLVRQWYDLLRTSFGVPVGVVGGGEYEVHDLTVTTYDSAYNRMDHLGNRFGLVVFDECHHLPSEGYALAAELCLAPFRLGLTATPERVDGREQLLDRLIGPLALRRDIGDLSGHYLAEYETVRVEVELTAEERQAYDEARATYRDYIRRMGIRMGRRGEGWGEFVMLSASSEAGQRAMEAYRKQRHLAFAASAKIDFVEHLLDRHRMDRTLVFTENNATAYEVSRRFLIPAITHQTKVTERSHILSSFADGDYTAVVTSKVLNEGVDVPNANVAIIISGSGSVREHVQRLGRVLRKQGDKRATLYELVTAETSETYTSERRREHDAYRG